MTKNEFIALHDSGVVGFLRDLNELLHDTEEEAHARGFEDGQDDLRSGMADRAFGRDLYEFEG